MKRLFLLNLFLLIFAPMALLSADVTVGAARTDSYVPVLKGKRVALFSNHTGIVGDKHTLDLLLENGVDVVTLFSPEHGFRGTADAGEHVGNSVDGPTGIPIASLYGGKDKRMPSKEIMNGLDVIVVDIQDVGLRFYTYYCTMIDLMNAAKKYGKEVVVLDRPNPNGMTVDGPILDMKYASGVGRLPIPVVHGTVAKSQVYAGGVPLSVDVLFRGHARESGPRHRRTVRNLRTPRHEEPQLQFYAAQHARGQKSAATR